MTDFRKTTTTMKVSLVGYNHHAFKTLRALISISSKKNLHKVEINQTIPSLLGSN